MTLCVYAVTLLSLIIKAVDVCDLYISLVYLQTSLTPPIMLYFFITPWLLV